MKTIGDTHFLYIKVGNMFAVAVSHGNAQVVLAFQFLHEVVKVLKSYFGDFTEESIRNNFVLIYELLDEVRTRRRALAPSVPSLERNPAAPCMVEAQPGWVRCC